jgi:hypothetical protein
MAVVTRAAAQAAAAVIRDETANGANTATRVGGLFLDIADSVAFGNGSGGDGFRFTFSTTTTDSDPGAGTLRFNHATPASVDKLYVDLSAYAGGDITDWLARIDDAIGTVKGYVRIQSLTDDTKWLLYKVTARTGASGYDKFDVTYVDHGAGGLPTTTAGDTFLSFDALGAFGLAHSDLSGLTSGDPHTQYALAKGFRGVITENGATRLLAASDFGYEIRCTAACVITAPDNIATGGEAVRIVQAGVGQVSVVGSGFTITQPPSRLALSSERYGAMLLTYSAADAADLNGDLEAADSTGDVVGTNSGFPTAESVSSAATSANIDIAIPEATYLTHEIEAIAETTGGTQRCTVRRVVDTFRSGSAAPETSGIADTLPVFEWRHPAHATNKLTINVSISSNNLRVSCTNSLGANCKMTIVVREAARRDTVEF